MVACNHASVASLGLRGRKRRQSRKPIKHIAYWRNSFWLVYPPHRRHQRKVAAFRTWLLAEVAASLRDDPFGALVPPAV